MLLFLFFPDSALSDDENSIMGPIRLLFLPLVPAHVRHLFAVGKRDKIAIISLFFRKLNPGSFDLRVRENERRRRTIFV